MITLGKESRKNGRRKYCQYVVRSSGKYVHSLSLWTRVLFGKSYEMLASEVMEVWIGFPSESVPENDDSCTVFRACENKNLGNRVSSKLNRRRSSTTPSIIATIYWLHRQPSVSAIEPPVISPRLLQSQHKSHHDHKLGTHIDPNCCPNKYTLNILPLSCAKNISKTLN